MEEDIAHRESANLLRLIEKIEERKKTLNTQIELEPKEITLKSTVDVSRIEADGSSPALNDIEAAADKEPASNQKKEKPPTKFKVLGNNDFQRKDVVSIIT